MSEATGDSPGTRDGAFALPIGVKQLVSNLQQRAEGALVQRRENLASLEGDEAFAVEAAALTGYVEGLLKASRTIVNAYCHAIANPRPGLQRLAAAQEITPSNLRRRYTPTHVAAVTTLLGDSPAIDAVQYAFPVVADQDFMGISKNIDHDVSMRLKLRATHVSNSLGVLTTVLSPERARESLLAGGYLPPNYGPTGVSGIFEFERIPLGMIGHEALMSTAETLGREYVKYAANELEAYDEISAKTK